MRPGTTAARTKVVQHQGAQQGHVKLAHHKPLSTRLKQCAALNGKVLKQKEKPPEEVARLLPKLELVEKPKEKAPVKAKEVKYVEPKGTCPYVDWYQFTACTIKTCKNHTDQTERKCIALDRVRPEGAKIISDAEIHFYKLKDAGLKGRIVQIKRKKAVDKIKCLLILHKFINYLRLNKEEGGVFATPTILEVEKLYPFKIKKLGWENWMWEYLLDTTVWDEFLRGTTGECKEYTLQQIISIKPVKFERLISEFNSPYKGTDNEHSTERQTDSICIPDNRPSRKGQSIVLSVGTK
jgi:hypothetical protein